MLVGRGGSLARGLSGLEERKEVGAGGFQVTPQAPPGSGGASRIQMLADLADLADLAVLGGNAEQKVSFDIGLVRESEAEGGKESTHDCGKEIVARCFNKDEVKCDISLAERLGAADGFFHKRELSTTTAGLHRPVSRSTKPRARNGTR